MQVISPLKPWRQDPLLVYSIRPKETPGILVSIAFGNGHFARYVKFWDAHAPRMPGTISPPPISKETASWRSRHASRHVRDARAVMHVEIANPWWQGKRSRYSWRMRNMQFFVSGKRPMAWRLLGEKLLPEIISIYYPNQFWHWGNMTFPVSECATTQHKLW